MDMLENVQNLKDISSSSPSQKGGVLLSSRSRSWEGITVEQSYNLAGEHIYSSSSSHLICLYTGNPIFLEQARAGQSHAGMVSRGDLHILPAGVEGVWRHQIRSDHLDVMISTNLMQRVAVDLHHQHFELLSYFHLRDPRLEHICLTLLAELTTTSSSGRLYIESLAISLAALLLHSYAISSLPQSDISTELAPPLVRKVLSVIEDRLSEDLGIVELASEVGLSPVHFSTVFRKSIGLSPHQYIVRRRVERAQCLLKSTRLSIQEIANAVGFYDHSHLVRHMKHILGVTPGSLRKN